MTTLTIDFFHDAVCCWCFNISSRLRRLQLTHVPSLIVRETGTRLVNGPLDDLRAQLLAEQRLAA